jgi:hypothetical protein
VYAIFFIPAAYFFGYMTCVYLYDDMYPITMTATPLFEGLFIPAAYYFCHYTPPMTCGQLYDGVHPITMTPTPLFEG